MTEFAELIADAIRTRQPLPPFPKGLTLLQGYELQREVAQLVSPGGFAGIKAGVTSEQLQGVFGIDHALLGRLYPERHLESGASLSFVEKQVIECEIGIVVDSTGTPVSAGLALEFACPSFSSPGDATAPNLVAGNVAADSFLTGEQLPYQSSYDDIVIRFFRNEELINEAPITESLGGPGPAIAWIMQEAKKYGIEVGDNTLLMTGACGQVVPALAGHYRADYGNLGTVEFDIN